MCTQLDVEKINRLYQCGLPEGKPTTTTPSPTTGNFYVWVNVRIIIIIIICLVFANNTRFDIFQGQLLPAKITIDIVHTGQSEENVAEIQHG